jgi:hypothetical protein
MTTQMKTQVTKADDDPGDPPYGNPDDTTDDNTRCHLELSSGAIGWVVISVVIWRYHLRCHAPYFIYLFKTLFTLFFTLNKASSFYS